MLDSAPTLSVYMLAYNHGKFIEEAIKSVVDQVIGCAYELVIGDDASSDETQAICEKYARLYPEVIRYVRHEKNLGAAENSKQIIALCRGKYLARLEGDDFMVGQTRLQQQVDWLDANPECMLVYGRARIIDESRTVLGVIPIEQRCFSGDVLEEMVGENLIPACTAVYRAEILKKLPGWRGLVRYGDYVANTLAADEGAVHCIAEVISCYRRHGSSMTARDSYEDNLQQLMDIHCYFIVNKDLSVRGVGLSRQALLRKLEVLVKRYMKTGIAIPWEELRKRYEACFESQTNLYDQFSALFDLISPPVPASLESDFLFSIILITYNRPAMLVDALRSVATQTNRDFEVVLVSDHGDAVEHLLSEFKFPLTYIYKGSNQGLSAARNTALRLARGRYICYLDDDDFYRPEHLAVLAEALEKHPDSVVYTGVEYVSETIEDGQRRVLGRSEPFKHESFDKELLFFRNYIPVNTWAHPRAALYEVGEFDTTLTALEDWDMLLRLAARYPFIHVPQPTAEVRARWAGGNGNDHLQSQEHSNFPELYQEIYRRHSDLGSERVRNGRVAQLRSLGVTVKADSAPVRTWLNARTLTPVQQRLAQQYVNRHRVHSALLTVLVLDPEADTQALHRSLESLSCQVQTDNIHFHVLSAAGAPAGSALAWTQSEVDGWVEQLNTLVSKLDSDWVMLLQAGNELVSSGLQLLGLELLGKPDCRAIFADALYRQDNGDLGAVLRPDLNLDYLLSFPRALASNWLFRRSELVALGGFSAECHEAMELDVILRLINQQGIVGFGHISEPLVLSDPPPLIDSDAERAVITRHLQERGYSAAQVFTVRPGQYRIEYGHADQPPISVVIIVQDQLAAAQRCVMSVLEHTGYPNYEILLIDNASRQPDTIEWLQSVEGMSSDRLRVLRSPRALAYSELCNQAALNSNGDYLLFLRTEAAILDDNWLDSLMNHALRQEVGAVGPRTVDAEGKVTHAGLVLGLEGTAGGVFTGESVDAPGYMQRLQVDQNPSALSDGCLLVRKSVYMDLGGLDSEALDDQAAVLDLCLRLTARGYMLVWTPSTTLLYAKIPDRLPIVIEDVLYQRWLPRLARDPAYNANFSLVRPGGFQLTDPQISWRPLDIWRPLPVVLAHQADMYGCGHYRVIQPFNALREAGLVDGALSLGLMHVTDLERYAPDVVVLQRQIGHERLEAMRRMKAFSSVFKVYELDDYLPNLPIKSAHRKSMPKDIVRSLKRGLGFVDRFVVSTQPLAEAFVGYHDDIRVVENRLDPRWWASLPDSRRGVSNKPRVGWAGGASHTGDLEMILDVVKDLADEVEWVFFGMCPDRLRPYVHEFHPGVAIDQYPRMLASLNLDLAIAPVEENLFNDCKSNLRLLEYGACRYPVICSDVRCYAGALPVTRVKNRYRDWMDAIRMHLSEPAASQAQGQALYEAVRRDWMLEGENLELWCQAWLP